jgi:copper chaperone
MSQSANLETATYTVPGMTCEHCTRAVGAELSGVAGVASVEVDLASKLVTVQGEQLDDAELRGAIVEAGYEAL